MDRPSSLTTPSRHMRPQDLDLAGRKVHFWKGGSGPCLLLLHAAWGDAELSWSPVWDLLAHAHTVIAPDLPGFGRSTALPRPSLSGMAGTIRELLDSLRMDRVTVVGNSFGAGVALQFAHDHPKATARVVLVNGGYMPVIPGPLRRLMGLPLLNRGFRSLIRSLTFSPAVLNRSFVNPSRLPAGFFQRIQETAPAYSRISFDTIMNMTAPLAAPSVPTLLLWGADDRLATLKQARTILRSLPAATLVTLEGAGHMPQVELPQDFASVIAAFLAGQRTGA